MVLWLGVFKMKKILLILMFSIFFLSSVSALDSLGTFQQGDSIRISQVCADATYINISGVSYPNGSLAVSGIEMTSAGSGEFYYLFSLTEDDSGRYDVRGISDGCEETFATYFMITPDGKTFTTQNSISYVGFILIILFTFFLTMYGISRIEWKHKKTPEGKILTINNFRYLKILLSAIAYFELMFLFGLSYKVCREADIEGFTQFFNFIYQIFLALIYPLMIFLIIIIFVTWINNRKLQKSIKLGL